MVFEFKILNFRFTFNIGSVKEIHTEVYAYGFIFSFAQDVGFRRSQVSRHWLYETTKGKFGEYSEAEKSIDQRFINNTDNLSCFNLKFLKKIMNRMKEDCIQNSRRLSQIEAFDKWRMVSTTIPSSPKIGISSKLLN